VIGRTGATGGAASAGIVEDWLSAAAVAKASREPRKIALLHCGNPQGKVMGNLSIRNIRWVAVSVSPRPSHVNEMD
jgi:hypothetical protein